MNQQVTIPGLLEEQLSLKLLHRLAALLVCGESLVPVTERSISIGDGLVLFLLESGNDPLFFENLRFQTLSAGAAKFGAVL